jgi:hypothetical protein
MSLGGEATDLDDANIVTLHALLSLVKSCPDLVTLGDQFQIEYKIC